MSTMSLKERLLGALAHIPIVTIIWICYVIYLYFFTNTFDGLTFNHFLHPSSPPLGPILLTLLSLPISLSIMRFKKRSRFVYQNADHAYHFSVWLLKWYLVAFALTLVSIVAKIKALAIASALLALVLSCNCFYQCTHGIITALGGTIFCYWYPWESYWYPWGK